MSGTNARKIVLPVSVSYFSQNNVIFHFLSGFPLAKLGIALSGIDILRHEDGKGCCVNVLLSISVNNRIISNEGRLSYRKELDGKQLSTQKEEKEGYKHNKIAAPDVGHIDVEGVFQIRAS